MAQAQNASQTVETGQKSKLELALEGKARQNEEKRQRKEAATVFGKYRVFSLDDLNWVIEDSENPGHYKYYPTFSDCLRLLDLKPGDRNLTDVKTCLATMEAIRAEIVLVAGGRK